VFFAQFQKGNFCLSENGFNGDARFHFAFDHSGGWFVLFHYIALALFASSFAKTKRAERGAFAFAND
jgi:hypothetical protein